MHKSREVASRAEELYRDLTNVGIEVLFDDRNERPGVMFADIDLIGIPHRLVIAKRGLDKGIVEYKQRRESEARELPLAQVLNQLQALIKY